MVINSLWNDSVILPISCCSELWKHARVNKGKRCLWVVHNWFLNQRKHVQSLAFCGCCLEGKWLGSFVVYLGLEVLCLVVGAFPWQARRGRCISVVESYCWMIRDASLHTFEAKLVCFVKIDFILRYCDGGFCKCSNSIVRHLWRTKVPTACMFWLEETVSKAPLIPTLLCSSPPDLVWLLQRKSCLCEPIGWFWFLMWF